MKRHKRTWEEVVNKEPDLHWGDSTKADDLVTQLWKGNHHAPRVQRIGIAVFGIALLSGAATYIYILWSDEKLNGVERLILMLPIATPLVYVGGRLLRNAFLRPSSKSDQE
jgi:hypothetical protein